MTPSEWRRIYARAVAYAERDDAPPPSRDDVSCIVARIDYLTDLLDKLARASTRGLPA